MALITIERDPEAPPSPFDVWLERYAKTNFVPTTWLAKYRQKYPLSAFQVDVIRRRAKEEGNS